MTSAKNIGSLNPSSFSPANSSNQSVGVTPLPLWGHKAPSFTSIQFIQLHLYILSEAGRTWKVGSLSSLAWSMKISGRKATRLLVNKKCTETILVTNLVSKSILLASGWAWCIPHLSSSTGASPPQSWAAHRTNAAAATPQSSRFVRSRQPERFETVVQPYSMLPIKFDTFWHSPESKPVEGRSSNLNQL